MWARTLVLFAGLVVWVVIRLALRRPLLHPCFVAFAVAAAGAAISDGTSLLSGPAARLGHVLSIAAALSAVALIAEWLRREGGSPPSKRRTVRLAFAAIAAVALLVAELPARQVSTVGGIIAAALLLNAIPSLLRAKRHRIGMRTFAAGIGVYALGRSAMVAAHVFGADERTTQLIADLASAVLFGSALAIYAVEDVRQARSASAVGHRRSVA